ncbi:MAG: membrane lipoprotein lipid attachment site-containing protein [Bacteroidales bacterium]|nr:membrane lipoprotein lipid attachment site-containing protein [Bacteroidales bacterium]
MKKLVVFFVIALLLSSCYTEQSLNIIDIDKPGRTYRWVQTYNRPVQNLPFGVFLDVKQSNDNPFVKIWSLVLVLRAVDNDVVVLNKSMLLLKFEDGSTLELTSDTSRIATSHLVSLESYYHGGFLHENRVTIPWYPITEDQIKDIINKKVVKIRIETFRALNDGDVLYNEFSKTIKEEYNSIIHTLAIPRTMYSDF